MLNHSVSQLRQVKISNICLPKTKAQRSVSGVSSNPHNRPSTPTESSGKYEAISRPSPLRRRSTRGNPYGEPSTSHLQRFESAILKHTYDSFIVLYDARETVYISEIQIGSSPTYLPFSLDHRGHSIELVAYGRCSDKAWQILCRHEIVFQDLSCVDVDVPMTKDNEVNFQFEEEDWYGFMTESISTEVREVRPKLESYSFNQVMRLQTSTEFVNDALQSIKMLKNDLETMLDDADGRLRRCHELSICRSALAELRTTSHDLAKQTAMANRKAARLRESIALRKSLLSSTKAHMASNKSDLESCQARSLKKLPALALLSSEIRRVQRQLTTSLSEIYPIIITADAARIRGLKTARNSDYWMQNHEEAGALGYTAHFIFLLSHYLAIPLRYPVRPISSHSFMVDPVSILPENSDVRGGPPYSIKHDRRYPLFFERGGVERLQWGAFLLNKNIEQLLQGRGLVCGDLRDSLQNLGGLVLWLMSVNEDEDKSLTRPATARLSLLSINGEVREGVVDGEEVEDALEITDHKDLLAAQLRSRQKGKRRMTLVSEKEGEEREHQSLDIPDITVS